MYATLAEGNAGGKLQKTTAVDIVSRASDIRSASVERDETDARVYEGRKIAQVRASSSTSDKRHVK